MSIVLISRTAEKLKKTAADISAKYSNVEVDYVAVDFSNFNAKAQKAGAFVFIALGTSQAGLMVDG